MIRCLFYSFKFIVRKKEMKNLKVAAVAIVFIATGFLGFAGVDEDQEYYADFVKFFEVSGSEDTQKAVFKQMFEQFKKMPNVKTENIDKAQKLMDEALKDLNKQLFPVYKKHLSRKDLKELIKLYQTPIGKKLVKVQPLIVKDSYQIGMQFGQNFAPKLIATLTAEPKTDNK